MNRHLDFSLGVPLVGLAGIGRLFRSEPHGKIKKLLVIKLAAAGDTIVLTPVLRSLRREMPDASIHWLVSNVNEAIARTVPHVDRLWVWQKGSLSALRQLIGVLRAERFDAVIDFEQWARGTALISVLTGAPRRFGFDTPGQHRALAFTHTFKKTYRQHEIDEFFGVASLLTPLTPDHDLELHETDAGRSEAQEVLASYERGESTRRWVLLHPGCGADGLPREWPLASYAVLGHWLQKQHGTELFLTAGPEEKEKSARLQRLLHNRARDLGGRLSWHGLISLVKRMSLVVSGNTGVMHVAAALKRPQVALHGPTNPVIWGPLNPHARTVSSSCPDCPCLRLGFEYHRHDQSCMSRIDVDDVKSACASLLV